MRAGTIFSISILSYLKASVWEVPFCPGDELIFDVQSGYFDGILLGSLVFHVMTESPREKYLVSIVDVATHTEFARLKQNTGKVKFVIQNKAPVNFWQVRQ